MREYTPENMALIQEFLAILPMMHRYTFQNPLDENNIPVSPNQMLAMLYLNLFPRSSMTQLASRLMVSKQQLTKIVDILVEKQMVTRLSDESNRRLVLLELTDSGRLIVETMMCLQAEKSARLFSDITDEERQDLMRALRLLERVLTQKAGVVGQPRLSASVSDILLGSSPQKG